jgi:subtilisin-like proprotein convertase family protein
MKKSIAMSGWLALTLSVASASIFTTNSGTLNVSIPDANPAGYVSTLNIAGLLGDTIQDVNVTLTISGGFNGDLYGYLVSPDGAIAVLLNRVGRTGTDAFGYSDPGFNAITLDDSAANGDIHLYTPHNTTNALAGIWAPDGRNINPANVVDTDTRNALLSALNGGHANGTWTLFLSDLSGGEISSLVSWGLTLDLVPEPTTWAMIIFGAGAAGLAVRNRFRRSRQ